MYGSLAGSRHFSVISDKFFTYFLVISRIFPISHPFNYYFSIVSQFFSLPISQLCFSVVSHFSVTPLSYRLDQSCGFVTLIGGEIDHPVCYCDGWRLVKFPWQLAGNPFWFCTLFHLHTFVLVEAHINCQVCGWRSSPISSVQLKLGFPVKFYCNWHITCMSIHGLSPAHYWWPHHGP